MAQLKFEYMKDALHKLQGTISFCFSFFCVLVVRMCITVSSESNSRFSSQFLISWLQSNRHKLGPYISDVVQAQNVWVKSSFMHNIMRDRASLMT